MTRFCSAIVALALVIVAAPATVRAQDTAKSSGMAGKIITKTKLAYCKTQAREQKLSYGKRRKFVRACVNG